MYQVLHARKIKTEAGLFNVARHNSREEIYGENLTLINPEKIPEWLKKDLSDAEKRLQSNAPKAADVLSLRKEKMQDLARKPQKNASAAVEFVVSASQDFGGNWQEFFDKAREFLIKKYGENVISCAIHADETTPHMHILFVPIIKKDGKRRYSSSEFLGKRNDLRKLHTEFYEAVGKLFGLSRGEENSRATHGDAKTFAKKVKDVERKKEELNERENELKSESQDIEKRKKIFAENETKLFDREKAVKLREDEAIRREAVINDAYRASAAIDREELLKQDKEELVKGYLKLAQYARSKTNENERLYKFLGQDIQKIIDIVKNMPNKFKTLRDIFDWKPQKKRSQEAERGR